MRSALVIMLVAVVSCSSDNSSSTSTSGGGSGRDCAAIEAEYRTAATAPTALDCAGDADCDGNFGLCKPDTTVVRGNDKGVYSKTTVQKLIPLLNEWLIAGCAGKNECTGSAGGAIACQNAKCGVK